MPSSTTKGVERQTANRIELRPKLVIDRNECPELWERFSKVSSKRMANFVMLMLNQSLANEKLAGVATALLDGTSQVSADQLQRLSPSVPKAKDAAEAASIAHSAKPQPSAPSSTTTPAADEIGVLSAAFEGGVESFLSLGVERP